MTKYHIDFNSFVVDEKTMTRINTLHPLPRDKFLKRLIDEGVLEIVNTDVADDDDDVDELHKYLPEYKWCNYDMWNEDE